MPDYPLNLQIEGRLCVVVGAGAVGLRKVRGLLAAGARVRLIDPQPPEELPAEVELVQRPYLRSDLEGALLAFAATDDPEINAALAAEARAAGVLVNRADDPAGGDFSLPAVLQRGKLCLAVTTGGESPALATVLRDRLARDLGPEWALVVEIAAALRRRRLTGSPASEYNQEILRRLLECGLPQLLAAGDAAGAERLLAEIAGGEMALEKLGIRLSKGRP